MQADFLADKIRTLLEANFAIFEPLYATIVLWKQITATNKRRCAKMQENSGQAWSTLDGSAPRIRFGRPEIQPR